jgi:hypothetical protein
MPSTKSGSMKKLSLRKGEVCFRNEDCIDAALFLGGAALFLWCLRRGRVYTLHITQIDVRVRTSGLFDRDFCEATLTTQNFVSPKPAISPTSTSRFVYCIDPAPFPWSCTSRFVYCYSFCRKSLWCSRRRGRVYTLHITQIDVRVRTSGLFDGISAKQP